VVLVDAGGLGVVDEGVEPLTPDGPEQAEHCLIPIVHPLRRGRRQARLETRLELC